MVGWISPEKVGHDARKQKGGKPVAAPEFHLHFVWHVAVGKMGHGFGLYFLLNEVGGGSWRVKGA